MNRTLHSRLGIRILSSRAESISDSKTKFESPRGHVISSMLLLLFANSSVVIAPVIFTIRVSNNNKGDEFYFVLT